MYRHLKSRKFYTRKERNKKVESHNDILEEEGWVPELDDRTSVFSTKKT